MNGGDTDADDSARTSTTETTTEAGTTQITTAEAASGAPQRTSTSNSEVPTAGDTRTSDVTTDASPTPREQAEATPTSAGGDESDGDEGGDEPAPSKESTVVRTSEAAARRAQRSRGAGAVRR